jgi:phosphatidylglycerophosphate synthase
VKSKITLEDVRLSISNRVKAHYSVRWFGRPIGNIVTPVFYNNGWSANQVTGFRTLLSAAAVLMLATGRYDIAIATVCLYFVTFVLDCVDGNLARLGGTVTFWGKFIDGLSDMVFPFFAPLAASVGIWLHTGNPDFMLIGSICGLVSLSSQLVRNRLSFVREWMISQTGLLDTVTQEKTKRSKLFQDWVAAYYVNATFFTPLLLLVPDYGFELYVLASIPTQMLPEAAWLCSSLLEGRVLLNRSRKSIHAPSAEELLERKTVESSD